jgi:hypothetical protein
LKRFAAFVDRTIGNIRRGARACTEVRFIFGAMLQSTRLSSSREAM